VRGEAFWEGQQRRAAVYEAGRKELIPWGGGGRCIRGMEGNWVHSVATDRRSRQTSNIMIKTIVQYAKNQAVKCRRQFDGAK
jgi:hypothetical protein